MDISKPCGKIEDIGSNELIGYIGSVQTFQELTNGELTPCINDPYFQGNNVNRCGPFFALFR